MIYSIFCKIAIANLSLESHIDRYRRLEPPRPVIQTGSEKGSRDPVREESD